MRLIAVEVFFSKFYVQNEALQVGRSKQTVMFQQLKMSRLDKSVYDFWPGVSAMGSTAGIKLEGGRFEKSLVSI